MYEALLKSHNEAVEPGLAWTLVRASLSFNGVKSWRQVFVAGEEDSGAAGADAGAAVYKPVSALEFMAQTMMDNPAGAGAVRGSALFEKCLKIAGILPLVAGAVPSRVDWAGHYEKFLSWRTLHLSMDDYKDGSDEDYWKQQWDHLQLAEAGEVVYTIPRSIVLVAGMVFAGPHTTAGVERQFSVIKAMVDPSNHGISTTSMEIRTSLRINRSMVKARLLEREAQLKTKAAAAAARRGKKRARAVEEEEEVVAVENFDE